MAPTISVLITYYNEKELLGECIDSLSAQTVMPDEIIVYDDFSYLPANDYVPKGAGVKVIRGERNCGPAYGRNVLLRATSCDYVHFHDADDLFAPNWVEMVKKTVEEKRVDCVFTEISSYVDDEMLSEKVIGLNRLNEGDDLVRFCIGGAMLTPSGTYYKQCVMVIGGYRETLWQSEDYDFHIRLAASGVSYFIINEPLIKIRIRSESRSHNKKEVFVSALEAIQFLSSEIPSEYNHDLAEAAARIGSRLYKLDCKDEARRAFRLAEALGPPTYSGENQLYRLLAGNIGPEAAEKLGLYYRKYIPEFVRTRLRS